MDKVQKIIEIIAEIMEVEPSEITLETELCDDVWDSLAIVTFISEVDSNFDLIVSPMEVSTVKTVADLINLVE